MNQIEQLLTRKNINRIAIPSIFAGIAEPFLSLTDLAIIGQVELNSVEVLAAVGVVGSFISAIIWILAQSKTAISTTVAQFSNPETIDDAKALFPQLVLVNVLVCLLILCFTIPFSNVLFNFYSVEGLTLNYATDYYNIRAFGIPLTLLTFSIFGVYRGLQNTIWAMYISIGGGLLNVGLDYALIHGIDGWFPALHIKGAAYASLISQSAMLIAAFWILYTKTEFRFKFKMPFHPRLKELLLFSANLFVRTLTLNVVIYITNKLAAELGNVELATHTILLNVWLFTCFFIDGYSNAANAISGKLVALNARHYMSRFWNSIFKYSMILSCICALLIYFFRTPMVKLFTHDSLVIEQFVGVSVVLILIQFLNGFAFSLDGLGKGLGEGKALRNSLLIATIFAFVPGLIFLNPLDIGLFSIWIPFLLWMLSRGVYLYFKLIYKT
ncbi:MAG: MATE family efflux transporter [Flavobacteriales bacterium]